MTLRLGNFAGLMTVRRKGTAVLLAALALVLGLLAGYAGRFGLLKAQTRSAFVAHETENAFSADRNAAPKVRESTYAYRSDGSWSHIYQDESPLGEVGTIVEFFDRQAGLMIHSHPFTRSTETYRIKDAEVPSYIAAGLEACDGSERGSGLKHLTLLGYDTVRVVKDRGFGVATAWVAPDLGCYPMQSTVLFRSGAHNDTRVTAIQLGEPPASMFQPSQGFVELSPAEMQDAYKQKYGVGFWNDRVLGAIKSRYEKHR